MAGSVQDWIEAFEKEMFIRFNQRVHVIKMQRDVHSIMESITRIVAEVCCVDYDSVVSNKRMEVTISDARMIAMYFIRLYGQVPYQKMGRFFGGRNHTTVMHLINRVKERIETKDPANMPVINAIDNRLTELFKPA